MLQNRFPPLSEMTKASVPLCHHGKPSTYACKHMYTHQHHNILVLWMPVEFGNYTVGLKTKYHHPRNCHDDLPSQSSHSPLSVIAFTLVLSQCYSTCPSFSSPACLPLLGSSVQLSSPVCAQLPLITNQPTRHIDSPLGSLSARSSHVIRIRLSSAFRTDSPVTDPACPWPACSVSVLVISPAFCPPTMESAWTLPVCLIYNVLNKGHNRLSACLHCFGCSPHLLQ